MPPVPTAPVLLVEDDDLVTEIMISLLWQLGFKDVEYTPDGRTALDHLKQKAFGLVLSDLRMEPMSGLALLRAVRSDEALGHMPFILTTASSATEDILAAKRSGADGYLVKPFTSYRLLRCIEAIPNLARRCARASIPQ